MNKAITDGLVFMPTPFAVGLDRWSSQNGTPGSATYQGSANAALVSADQDFGGCVELIKTQATTQVRYMTETPLLPGCYLMVTARVKAMSGNLPSVRIAGWAGGAGGLNVPGLVSTGPSVALTAYGQVVTVRAIVGSGMRIGVDMPWGTAALYGHFGIDLTGANGGVVRINDIEIEDVTSVFQRKMMDWEDVRDYGAKGDGVTDDSAAFVAADSAALAAGRSLLVSAGVYFLNADVTIGSPVRFEGTVTMPVARRLALAQNFDLQTYAKAFGSEEVGFRKAFQALLNFTDHNELDLNGRRIAVTAPIDMQAAVANKTTFSVRRVIRNGQFEIVDGPGWATGTVTSQATYNPAVPNTLTGVVNIANVPVGSLVTGTSVGREVYVTAVNAGASTLTLSQPLYDAAGTQVFTFMRFRYILDFSRFAQLDRLQLADIDFQCNGYGSAIMLAPAGDNFQLRDCYVTRPKDRGITSIGTGCQDLHIDRCQFLSNEQSLPAQSRVSIALNINANDAKIRENRIVRFRHFAVVNGGGHLIVGNHWFQGDSQPTGVRLAGLVLTQTNVNTTVTGNYIDNSFIEWTNEYEADPDFGTQYSFGGLTVTGNIFMAIGVAPWFRWLVVKPYGTGHFIQGLSVLGNTFRAVNATVDRVEAVDTTFAALDYSRMRNVVFDANSFNAVTQATINPVRIQHDQATAATTWTVQPGGFLPFGGWSRNVESVVAEGAVVTSANAVRNDFPSVSVGQGASKQDVAVAWPVAVRGRLHLGIRMDNPT
ncbi:MAG: glycosyl hydrolase family 28-related protein [Paracoccaceae bacterium]